jgi:hypothetical protein
MRFERMLDGSLRNEGCIVSYRDEHSPLALWVKQPVLRDVLQVLVLSHRSERTAVTRRPPAYQDVRSIQNRRFLAPRFSANFCPALVWVARFRPLLSLKSIVLKIAIDSSKFERYIHTCSSELHIPLRILSDPKNVCVRLILLLLVTFIISYCVRALTRTHITYRKKRFASPILSATARYGLSDRRSCCQDVRTSRLRPMWFMSDV